MTRELRIELTEDERKEGTGAHLMLAIGFTPQRRYAVKVVPNDTPNADGDWINIECRPLEGLRFSTAAEYLGLYHIPASHHVVAIRSNN